MDSMTGMNRKDGFQLILFDLIGKEYPLESLIERGRQTPKSTHLQKGGIGGGKSPDTKG